MPVKPEFVIKLQGREYPIWPGVLDLAHQRELTSLIVRVLQIPAAENGNVAICEATAVFADGRTFCDVGDASPNNVKPQMVNALLRLASTRSKGRVLRDACNVGDELLEEREEDAPRVPPPPRPAGNPPPVAPHLQLSVAVVEHWAVLQQRGKTVDVPVRNLTPKDTEEAIIAEGKAIRRLIDAAEEECKQAAAAVEPPPREAGDER